MGSPGRPFVPVGSEDPSLDEVKPVLQDSLGRVVVELGVGSVRSSFRARVAAQEGIRRR